MEKFLKKIWHSFFINEKGAVSIYLIIVALLLLLFNAVLIDYARILVAERQTEEAAKTALRSTMSSYHASLQNKGLFAFSGEQGEAENIFKDVFKKNLSTNDEDQYNFLGLKPIEEEINVNLNMERSLANKDILKYQILEEMKYKAPVEVGLALMKDFLSVSEQVEEASNYAEIAKDLNGAAKEREELLDQAIELLEESKSLLNGIKSQIQDPSNSIYPSVDRIEDIASYYLIYIAELEAIKVAEESDGSEDEDDNSDLEKTINKMKQDTSKFKERSIRLLDELVSTSTDASTKLAEALDLIEEAEGINNAMQDQIAEHNETGSSGDYENAKNISEELNDSTIGENTEGSLDDYVYDDNFFTVLKEQVENAVRKVNVACTTGKDAIVPKLDCDFKPMIESDFEITYGGGVINNVNNTQSYHTEALTNVNDSISTMADGRKEYLDSKDAIKEEEQKADESMDESKQQLEDIEAAINGATGVHGDNTKYAELGEKAADYGEAIEANNREFAMEDRDETADEAFSFIDTLFKNIGDLLVSARDEVYINEYILMRFNSHDFDKSGVEANFFLNNQVEYIIYGKELHGMNYFAALSEIFAVRFAINMAAGFMRPEARGFGPFIWAYALAFSFQQTALNMTAITNGESIPIWPNTLKPTMDYKDHLRLFLFAHPEGGKFNRVMAVLDSETGKDLRESPTYISAEATASINLWFLPQIIDMIDSTNMINGRVEGNEFFIEKEVNFSY